MNIIRPHASVSLLTRSIIIGAWILAVLVYWYGLSSPITPKPGEILRAFGEIWSNGDLAYPLWVSFSAVAQALLWTSVITLIFSYATVLPLMHDVTVGFSALRFLGMTGLFLAFQLVFHTGWQLKIALLTFGMTVFSLTQFSEEIANIPQIELDDARTLRMSDWRVVWEVVVLGRLHAALIILRQNSAMGWSMLTLVEGIVRSGGGIGTLLIDMRTHFQYDKVFAILLALTIVGLLWDGVLAWTDRIICPYAQLTLEKK